MAEPVGSAENGEDQTEPSPHFRVIRSVGSPPLFAEPENDGILPVVEAISPPYETGNSSPVLNRRRRRGTEDGGPSPQRLKIDDGGFCREQDGTIQKSQGEKDDEDGSYCPICFEVWSNSGFHRVVSLKCGHLFGLGCIQKWILSNGKGARCPQCNEVAQKKDIRPIYIRNLKAIDTSERDRALSEVERLQENNRLLELENHKLQLQSAAKDRDIARLQQELQQCRAALSGACLAASGQAELPLAGAGPLFGPQPPGILGKRLTLESTIELCKEGSCRVLAYSEYLTLLVASYSGINSSLTGTGIKKISALDGFRICGYIPIHRKQIRDMSFHPEQHDMLLTVSVDKTARLVNVHSNCPVQTYNTDAPLWSCCWNTNNPYQFFVGTASGKVMLFDTRRESVPINVWTENNSTTPVIGLGYLPFSPVSSFPRGGLFAQQLHSCSFYEARGPEEFIPHILAGLEGPFSSLSVEPVTRHVLISCKPSTNHQLVRHIVCAPALTAASAVSCQPVTSIKGGNAQKYLSRSTLMAVPGSSEGKQLVIASHDEASQSLFLWDVNSASVLHKLPTTSPALDLLPFRVNGQEYFSALTERQLLVYKWV